MLRGYENGEKYCFDSRLNETSSVHLERLWQSICDNIKQIFTTNITHFNLNLHSFVYLVHIFNLNDFVNKIINLIK